MKKKIKDLTRAEFNNICDSVKNCDHCKLGLKAIHYGATWWECKHDNVENYGKEEVEL